MGNDWRVEDAGCGDVLEHVAGEHLRKCPEIDFLCPARNGLSPQDRLGLGWFDLNTRELSTAIYHW